MLSVVVPTLNAGAELASCLEALQGADELIVVDGGSADWTVATAGELGARVISTAAGRGIQLRAGAAAASGDWLLFVHADTILEPGWRAAVSKHIEAQPDKAAYFRLRLRAGNRRARLIERAVDWRCRLFAQPYGDQGLLVSRTLYDELGGFAPIPLMEDVDLVRRIGARRLVGLDVAASTSAARWQQDGWAARSLRNLACLLLYRAGVSPERLVQLYR